MGLRSDPECRAAIERAKAATPDGEPLRIDTLLGAIYHGSALKSRFPSLRGYFEEPRAVRDAPPTVPLSEPLKPILGKLARGEGVATTVSLFRALVESVEGRASLLARGASEAEIDALLAALKTAPNAPPGSAAAPASPWRESAGRQEAIRALDSFGRMLTIGEPPDRGRTEMEGPLQALTNTLSKMGRRNAIICGFAGTGKTALVYELARRMVRGDASLPPPLRDRDIFELSPAFLRSGASIAGQYEERLRALIAVLRAHPKIILFVDEIHSFFQSSMHGYGPFADANEVFKGVLARGEITCIGCSTPAEFRHFIQGDPALERRFEMIKLDPPSPDATKRILRARRPKLEEHYAPLRIPDSILDASVDWTEEYLPSRQQPDKAIQLLDQACAIAVNRRPPDAEVTEEVIRQALEQTTGTRLARAEELTEESIFRKLAEKIVGQDEVLREISRAVVSGLGGWRDRSKPRGVFLFGGPTGVGKTEVAVLLAEILGGGRTCLIRVDGNTLQGSGYDGGPVINRLLGVPAGYVGYVRGQGGILGRIRDLPESVVLFDEFEKADPSVGRLLLRILDEGRCEDVEGNLLDFRRSFIIFTTNAGCVYQDHSVGFLDDPAGPARPRVDREALVEVLEDQVGLAQEFMGRITHVFLFSGLDAAACRRILETRLDQLCRTAETRGFRLTWEPDVIPYLAARWNPSYGVRHLATMLRNRITEQLNIAEAQGELAGVTDIHLERKPIEGAKEEDIPVGIATRARRGSSLIIYLA